MRRPNIDNVEIVEPPIEELRKGRSSFRRTCFTGCGCVVLFVATATVAIWLALGPGPKTLKTLPPYFPKEIPIYDNDNIDRITYVSGKYKSRGMGIAGFFPKIIFSPLLIESVNQTTSSAGAASTPSHLDYIKKTWQLLRAPVVLDAHDSIQIEWKNLDAEPSFIISYYRKELRKVGYTIEDSAESPKTKINFSNSNGVNGLITANGDEEHRSGTDYVLLIVNLATSTVPL